MTSVTDAIQYSNSSFFRRMFGNTPKIGTILDSLVDDVCRAKISREDYYRAMNALRKKTTINNSGRFSAFATNFAEHILSDGLVTDEERENFYGFVNTFQQEFTLNADIRHQVETANWAWKVVSNGEVWPNPPIVLKKGEAAYYFGAGYMGRMKNVTTSVSYLNPQMSIPIPVVPGGKVRIGNVRGKRHTQEQFVTEVTGDIIITDSRVIVSGTKTKAFTFNSITKVELHRDGFSVHRNSGQVLIFCTGNAAGGYILNNRLNNA